MGKRKENSRRKLIDNNSFQQETKFRIIADNTYDFEFWINPEGRYIYASPACKRITGYKPEEFFKDPSLRKRMVHPDDLAIVKQHGQQKEKKHLMSEVEYRLIRKDGSIRWISHACRPVFSDNGKYLGLRGSNRDITARKKIEEESIHLASFPEINPRPICEIDFHGNIRYINPALRRLFPEIVRSGMRHPWFTDFKIKIMPRLRNRKENIITRELEIGKYHFEQDITYISERELIRIYGQDITERKRVAEALKVSELRYRRLFESAKDGIVILDFDTGMIVDVNPFLVKLLGYSYKDLLKKHIWDIGIFKDVVASKSAFLKLKHKSYIRYEDLPLRLKDGTKFDVEFVSNVYLVNGKKVIQCNIRDITERVRAELALRHSEERFRIVSHATNDAVWDWDLATNRVLWNKNIEILFGYPHANLGTDIKWWYKKLHPEDRKRVVSSIHAVIDSGKQFWSQEYRFLRQDNSYAYVLDRGFVMHDEKNSAIRMIGSMMDLTEQKKKELELQKLNRTLKALSNSSKIMMRANNESAYLKDVCRIIVHDCGYSMAWIGFTENGESKIVRPVAQAGFEKGYLKTLNITWADTERGRGPTGRAIRTGKPAICKNILTDSNFRPWRREAIKRGYASSIVLPLLNDKKAFGAINIYAKEPDPFPKQEVELLTELSNDVAYGIMAIRSHLERKQLQQSLQKSYGQLEKRVQERTRQLTSERQRLYAVMETLPVYVILLTPDYHVSFANKFFRERFGESHGRCCFDYLFKRKEPCENCETYKVLQNKLPYHWEWLGPDGRNYDIYDFPFTETDGSTHIMEMGIDITERKRAEEGLRQVSLYVRNLIEASLDPLVTIDAEGKITDVNSATELVTGYGRKELIGTDFCDYFTEPEKARSGYQQVFKEGLVRDYPLEICHRNGHTTPVLYNATVYRNEKGDVVGIFAAARDISERKKAERALLEAEKEVERAKRLTGIGMLASTVAHELRNPLAAIKMAGYNIKKKAKDPTLDKHLLNIETKLTESEQIISNLLFYSKIRIPHLGKINLHNILNVCIGEAAERFSKYSVAIEKKMQPIKDLLIEADPLQIKEVFSNVLNNAFDAILEHSGRIKIEATADDGAVKVSIEDTGVGISKEDLERLFEPFFTTKAKGTGLGLAICQQITHLHGGSIDIESEKNKGTTVTVTLPINQKKNA